MKVSRFFFEELPMQVEQFEANTENLTSDNTVGSLGIDFEDFQAIDTSSTQLGLPILGLVDGNQLANGDPEPLDGNPPLLPNPRRQHPGNDSV